LAANGRLPRQMFVVVRSLKRCQTLHNSRLRHKLAQFI
jgi:hypothetical protein